MTDDGLSGAVVLVTAADSGIGAATARRLAREGAAIALVGRRRDQLDQLAAYMSRFDGVSLVVDADIAKPELAEQAVTVTLDHFGRLDILVNNACIMLLGTALHTTVEEWDRMIGLNVKALMHVTHAAVPYLIDDAATSHRQVADIVNVSSTAGRAARAGTSGYTLTKFAVNGFTESLRQELLIERVRVSVVEPGTVGTELLDHLDDATLDNTPHEVTGTQALRSDDVADAIAYIVTRDRGVAVGELTIRAADQTW